MLAYGRTKSTTSLAGRLFSVCADLTGNCTHKVRVKGLGRIVKESLKNMVENLNFERVGGKATVDGKVTGLSGARGSQDHFKILGVHGDRCQH